MTLRLAFNASRNSLEQCTRSKKGGFGAMALVLVLLFTSITAVAIYTTRKPAIDAAANEVTLSKMTIIGRGLLGYYETHANTNAASLDDLVTTGGAACAADTNNLSATYRTLQGWCGPYVDRPFVGNPNDFKTDAWGTAFFYNGVAFYSCGPDKVCANGDDISGTSLIP